MQLDDIIVQFVQNILNLVFGFLNDLFEALANLFGAF